MCTRLPNPFDTFITDVDRTTDDGSIVCQNLSDIEHTVRNAYAAVRAVQWLKSLRPPLP